MTHEQFFDRIGDLLRPLGGAIDDGEEFREPPLDVLRYHTRPVRLHWIPVLGRASSVVAIVRQPPDLSSSPPDVKRLLDRLARAVHGRYPPWPRRGPGLVVGLTAVVLTPEPIRPGDEEAAQGVFAVDRRSRVVPLGLLRINLGQEAMALALGPTLRDAFPEPFLLAEGLSAEFGRFVAPLEFE